MNAPIATPTPPYHHTPLFPLGPDKTPYRKLEVGGVTLEKVMGKDMLVVAPEALRALAEAAFTDINHLLRPAHLKQLRAILDDPQSSPNDKFVAYDFLKNANIAAGGDVGVFQKIVSHELVVRRRLRVVEDGAQLLEVRRAQQMIDVGEGGLGQRAQSLMADHQHVLAHHLLKRDAADLELAIGRLVGAEREQRCVVVGRRGGGD